MRVVMKYGKKGFPLDVPDSIKATIVRKRPMPLLSDPVAAMKSAFFQPVGCRNLAEVARGCKKICILICDITRPVPNSIVLPQLIQELLDGGARPESITVLVATGLHRPNVGDELRELVGDGRVLRIVRVENHFARNDADHVYLGTTPRGMPVKLDRRFVDADLRIAVGLVEPHFMAGYSGGRKVIVPGVAHQDTINVLHSTRMLNNEGVANCVLDGNPMHEEQMHAVGMVGESFAINTVIDEDGRISFINFGATKESHLAAVAFARPYFEVPLDRRFKTVVTSAAGYPLDRNYYQTVKGMVSVAGILEPGSDIFIASECSEGLGAEEYARSQARLVDIGMEAFLADTAAKEFAAIDEWETVMQIKAMKAGTVHLFSECLTREQKALTSVHVVEGSLMEAVEECVQKKHDTHVAFVPEGPYVIPFFSPESPGC